MLETVIMVLIAMFAVFGFYSAMFELKLLLFKLSASLSKKKRRD